MISRHGEELERVADCCWCPAGAISAPSHGSVDVWRVSFPRATGAGRLFECMLSPAEVSRAQKFLSAADQDQYVILHGALRRMLAELTRGNPAELSILTNENGKPTLASVGGAGLSFNLSHTKGLGLVAISVAGDVGVDVEWRAPDFPFEDIADRFFSRTESEKLQSLPASRRRDAFFAAWVRKESTIKALGRELGTLDTMEVLLGEPLLNGRELSHAGSCSDTGPLWVRDLETGPDWAAAVAVTNRTAAVRCLEWSENSRYWPEDAQREPAGSPGF